MVSLRNQTTRGVLLFVMIMGGGALGLRPFVKFQEQDLIIPLTYENIPKGLVCVGERPRSVKICIKGPAFLLERYIKKKKNYPLDLKQVHRGMNPISIDKKLIGTSMGLSILKVTPPRIALSLEDEIQKKLSIQAFYEGAPMEGYILKKVTLQPTFLLCRGPKSVLMAVDTLMTKKIDLSNVAESFKKEVALELPEQIDIISPAIVIANIQLEELRTTVKIEDIIVKGKKAQYPFHILPERVAIEIYGPFRKVEKIQREKKVDVYVDLSDLKPGVYARRAVIGLPLDLQLVSVKPEVFTVNINTD